MNRRIGATTLVFLLVSSVARAQEAEVKPNELRTGWLWLYGGARRVASAGKQAGVWLSYDVLSFSLDLDFLGKAVEEWQWALASIRTEPPTGRGIYFEAGAGWGTLREETGSPSSPTIEKTTGLGWQADLGYRFTPSRRMDVKANGVSDETFIPWLTLAFNF
jgi:hypothetical protein